VLRVGRAATVAGEQDLAPALQGCHTRLGHLGHPSVQGRVPAHRRQVVGHLAQLAGDGLGRQ